MYTCWHCDGNGYYSDFCGECGGHGYIFYEDGGGGGGSGGGVDYSTVGEGIATEGEAVLGSPNVTKEALEAALDGGSRYCYQFGKNILTALNPQTYADALGGIVGHVVNIADSGTRTQVTAEINDKLQSLTVAQTWKDAGEYLITPEGLADITSNLVLEAVPAKFGSVKIADNIPDNVASRTAQRIGATGKYGEDWLAARYGTNQHVYFPTSKGKRFVDNLGPDNVARESKVGATNLTEFVKKQIQKDVELRTNADVAGVEWHFFDSEISGPGGPSSNLKAYLDAKDIPVYYNGELLPPGPWTKP